MRKVTAVSKQSDNKNANNGSEGKRTHSLLPIVFISAIRMWVREWRRFCVLAVIAMLGVAVMTGIYAGCNDMFLATNDMYAKLHAYDLQIVSTLGLTKDDVAALRALPSVSEVEAERSWKATAHATDDAKSSYAMNFVHYVESQKNLNRLHLLKGNMPKNNSEAVVTQRFLHDSGLSIGNVIVVNMQQNVDVGNLDSSNSKSKTYRLRITGSVLDSNDLNNPDGYQSKAFRNSVTSRYPIFTSAAPDNVTGLPYTAISVRLNDTQHVNVFSKDYRGIVDDASEQIQERVQSKRETARRNQIIDNQVNSELKNIIANDPRLQRAPNFVKEQAKKQIRKQIKSEIQKRVPQAQWHISTRIANDSYASLRSDVASIQSLGYAFPAVFLVVAMMMSLTAMARMVEEERGLIGTYLSLGYGRSTAVTRHAFFAIFACFVGGGIGDIMGFLAIPSLLLKILRGLYAVPDVRLKYDWLYGSLCVLAFVIPVAICTIVVSW